jgi:hypothetical protein
VKIPAVSAEIFPRYSRGVLPKTGTPYSRRHNQSGDGDRRR